MYNISFERPRWFNKIIRLPTNWKEVKSKNVFQLIVHQTLINLPGYERYRIHLLRYFIPFKFLKFLSTEERTEVLKILSFVEKPINYPAKPYIKARRLITIKLGIKIFEFLSPFSKKLFLPKQNLSDVLGAEFARAMKQLVIYENKGAKDTKHLDKFVALLCRPNKNRFKFWKTQTERIKFDGFEKQLKYVENMHPIYKHYVLEYILNSLNNLKKAPALKVLFPSQKKEDPEAGANKPKKKPQKADPNQWANFMFTIAETGICGPAEKVNTTSIQTLLFIAAKKHREAEAQEQRRIAAEAKNRNR